MNEAIEAVDAVVHALILAVRMGDRETRERALELLGHAELESNLLRHAKLWILEIDDANSL